MAQTNYSKTHGKAIRAAGTLSRQEWSLRAAEFCPKGQEMPQSKLVDMDVITIRSAAKQRENLRSHIRDNLSNQALAIKFNTHVRNIEKILTRETWRHI